MEKIIHEKKVYSIDIPISANVGAGGEVYIVCPICSPMRKDKHKSQKKLAVNLNKIPNPWRCNHCGAGGYLLDEDYMAKAKVKPILDIPKTALLSDPIVKFFKNSRGLNVDTLEDFKIMMSKEQVYQAKNKKEENIGEFLSRDCVNFPYYMNGLLINVKYRDSDKNFKLIPKASKILYNIDSMENEDYVVITEGEFDAMCFHQAGIKSVVSVPNGVTITEKERKHYEEHGRIDIQSNINLEYLDNCIGYFKDKKKIYIATDTDAPGIKLREELARRLGKERCLWISFDGFKTPEGEPCKDANDVLLHHGIRKLAAMIHSASAYPVEGVYPASAFLPEMLVEFDEGRKKGLTTGYKSLDNHLNWMRGWLAVVNGYPGSGKSAFLFNLICITTFLYKWKWGMYCPENYPPKNIVDTMVEIIVGNTADSKFQERMTKTEYEYVIREHLGKYIFFLDNERGFTPEQLREKKKQMINQHGIVGFLTDPWKNLVHNYRGMRDDQYLGQVLGEEVRFTTKYNMVNLIAHHPPNPITDKSGKIKVPTQYNLTGGAVWSQSAYQIFTIHRQDSKDIYNTMMELHINKVKEHKLAGLPTGGNPILLRFDRRTNRFYESEVPDDESRDYDKYPVDNIFDNNDEKIDDEF